MGYWTSVNETRLVSAKSLKKLPVVHRSTDAA
jgi:hypothetical protein